MLLRGWYDSLSELSGDRIGGRWLIPLEEPRVVREDIRASVSDQIVDVLAVHFLIKYVDIVSFSLLDICD